MREIVTQPLHEIRNEKKKRNVRNGLTVKLRCNGLTAVRPVLARLDYMARPDDLDVQISVTILYVFSRGSNHREVPAETSLAYE